MAGPSRGPILASGRRALRLAPGRIELISTVEHSVDRARQAYEGLAVAESFVDARSAWEDFLIHWRRGLNRCDAAGRRHRRDYVAAGSRVDQDAALAYLWEARNADEHGLAPVASAQDSVIAIGAFGGYEPGVEERPNGERVYTFTPTSDDPPPFIAFLPEHLRLEPVRGLGRVMPVPPGYDYDLGETFAAVALAKYGLDFLMRELANLGA